MFHPIRILSGCPSLNGKIKYYAQVIYTEFVKSLVLPYIKKDGLETFTIVLRLFSRFKRTRTKEAHMELIFLACSQWTYNDKKVQIKPSCYVIPSLPSCVFGSNKSLRAESSREVFYYETSQSKHVLQTLNLKYYFLHWILKTITASPSSGTCNMIVTSCQP